MTSRYLWLQGYRRVRVDDMVPGIEEKKKRERKNKPAITQITPRCTIRLTETALVDRRLYWGIGARSRLTSCFASYRLFVYVSVCTSGIDMDGHTRTTQRRRDVVISWDRPSFSFTTPHPPRGRRRRQRHAEGAPGERKRGHATMCSHADGIPNGLLSSGHRRRAKGGFIHPKRATPSLVSPCCHVLLAMAMAIIRNR